MDRNAGIRLNKFIAESGMCSRREADKFIEKGAVMINGRRAVVGDVVRTNDKVSVNGNKLEPLTAEDKVYIAFNKPVGVTCTTEDSTKGNIVDYVNHATRVFNIGRLDKDSQGLIFLTNDGDIVNKILRAENAHEKEYLVTVDKPITEKFITSMATGVPILGQVTKKCKVSQESTLVFRITLIQGLNRQIRRMCEYFGYEVRKLERVRFMNVSLTGIPRGEWRDLSDKVLDGIFSMSVFILFLSVMQI
jgi:23S rRNA pseudouridine2604 synthase